MNLHVPIVFVVVTAWNIATTNGAIAEGAIRLVNGNNASEGRVEIYLQGQWGTICDDYWDIREATVVCKQLGFLGAISAVGSAEFGEGSGPIQLDDLNCVGNETAIIYCSARSSKEHDCFHFEDAGVRCNPQALSCHRTVANFTRVARQRIEAFLEYYRGGFWNWRRKSRTVYRITTYYVDVIIYGREKVPPVDGGWSSWIYGSCSKSCGGGTRQLTRTCNNPAPSCGGNECSGSNSGEVSCNTHCCRVDGRWSSWGYGSCSKSCGGGTQRRTRICNNPAPSCGGNGCSGSNSGVVSCNNHCCRVNGDWGSWRYGSCSKSCGGGTRRRTRICNDPAPSCGGNDCSGSNSDVVSCNTQCCRVDGGWSSWTCGSCIGTCGDGTKQCSRKCNSPVPSCGGNGCSGPSAKVQSCTSNNPVNGGWGSWSYGSCSKSCGDGTRQRTRICNNPAPSCGGNGCSGSSSGVVSCNNHCCRVDGGWSSWTEGSCTKTCGGGIKQYTRSCNNPTPSCGGLPCTGNSTYEESCNENCCPIDGGWSSWSQGSCSKTCGDGIKHVARSCNNPTPSCGGSPCTGNSTREEACNEICCHVDGGWSSWTEGSCSKACGGGIKQFTRSCSNPTPSCGGLSCIGNGTYEEECNKFCCRVDGRWSSWKPVGGCSKTCGGGTLKFFRTCTKPAPSCGGTKCRGISIFVVQCNKFCCRVDGGWSNWSAGNCSELCDGGTKEKTRNCSNPAPSCGGSKCIGETVETVECNTMPCIGPWSNWNTCSVSCGNGTKYRTRTCITECENGTIQYKDCYKGCCSVDGGWSSWYNQTECSVSCGGGVLTQWRNCTQPTPSCNGSECQGENNKTVDCNTHCCPVDGGWSNWLVGNCSKLCDGGNKTKTRTCNNPAPSCGGSNCIGESIETVECNTNPCVVDGGWSEWRLGPCSKTCGGGIQNYTRVCDNPKPLNGGKQCEGPSVYTHKELCNIECCPVHGGWSDWQNVTNCSTTCGEGVITQQRTCTQPSPSCGGRECFGINITNISCSNKCCHPVDGGWSGWEHGPCTKACGGGKMSMIRKCNNPEPSCGGNECIGSNIFPLESPCNDVCCPVDGGWSEWKNISGCSRTCGEGIEVQTRSCSEPPSSCGGKYCDGPDLHFVPCNISACCPVNGNWSEWKPEPCSKTCGGGVQNYTRVCDNPKPSCGGKECDGLAIYIPKTKCNNFCCPVDGGWSNWLVGNCTTSCVKSRTRLCNNPAPSCGGKNCSGPAEESMNCTEFPCEDGWGNWSKCSVDCGNGTKFRTRECTGECKDKSIEIQYKPCYMGCCPVNGGWNEWVIGPCSKPCGGGRRNITRECNKPKPSCNGKDCDGLNYHPYPFKCNNFCCPVDGGWSDWNIGSCSVTCGGGIREKFRLCDNPRPSCDGKPCNGSNIDNEECNELPCS